MKTLRIKLPDGVFKWLRALARKQKQTEAEVAQAALAAAASGRRRTLGHLAALLGVGPEEVVEDQETRGFVLLTSRP